MDNVCCNQCEKIFCVACIRTWHNHDLGPQVIPLNRTCPNCRFPFNQRKVNRNLLDLMREATFNCDVDQCNQIFKYSKREDHLLTDCILARKLALSCPFECNVDVKQTITHAIGLEAHVKHHCKSDLLKCTHC